MLSFYYTTTSFEYDFPIYGETPPCAQQFTTTPKCDLDGSLYLSTPAVPFALGSVGRSPRDESRPLRKPPKNSSSFFSGVVWPTCQEFSPKFDKLLRFLERAAGKGKP